MITIGLTGGSGSGKGYISSLFAAAGVPSLDTDTVSRLVCMPGSECLSKLVDTFGGGILLSDGCLDRHGLSKLAFADPNSTAALNSITHRYILAYCRRWLSMISNEGLRAAIIDAPQLYESGFDRECDCVIAVVACRELRIARITERDNITREHARLRLARQLDDGFFRRNADYIIENNYDESNPDNGALACRVGEIILDLGLTEGKK